MAWVLHGKVGWGRAFLELCQHQTQSEQLGGARGERPSLEIPIHPAPIPNKTQPLPPSSGKDSLSHITIKGDNQSSISLAKNPVLHTRTEHIDIQHHYICDEVTSGRIYLVYTLTEEMLADGLTKPLSHVKFLNFVKQLRME